MPPLPRTLQARDWAALTPEALPYRTQIFWLLPLLELWPPNCSTWFPSLPSPSPLLLLTRLRVMATLVSPRRPCLWLCLLFIYNFLSHKPWRALPFPSPPLHPLPHSGHRQPTARSAEGSLQASWRMSPTQHGDSVVFLPSTQTLHLLRLCSSHPLAASYFLEEQQAPQYLHSLQSLVQQTDSLSGVPSSNGWPAPSQR